MISIRKLIANWLNARKSTGPRTPGGKQVSSGNSTTHGLFARNTPIFAGEENAFAEFSRLIYEDLQPQGPTEQGYADRFIDQCWRLGHCLHIETDMFEWYRLYKKTKGDVGVAFANDASQLNCFGRLSHYARRFERGMLRELAELAKLQARRGRPAAPPPQPAASPDSDQLQVTTTGTNVQQVTPASTASASVPCLGIFSDRATLSDEDPAQFRAYCESLFAEWQPRGAVRACFVDLFAVTSLRLDRASRVEGALFEQYRVYENADGGPLTAFVQDAAELDCFGKLARYETPIRNSLSRILKMLLADG